MTAAGTFDRQNSNTSPDAYREAEHVLLESPEFYKTLVETSPDSITMTDLEGKFIMVNKVAVALHGYASKEEMIGRSAFDLIAPQDRERAYEYAKMTLETGRISNVEYALLRKDGSSFRAELSASLVKDSAGNPRAIIGIVRDITQRKMIEEALAEERDLLSVTMRSISDAVIAADAKGNILFINKRAEEFTGWKNEEAFDKSIDTVVNVQDKNTRIIFSHIIKNVIETRAVFERYNNHSIIDKSGNERKISEVVSPLVNKHNVVVGVVLVLQDITDKEKLEKELFRSRKLESIGIMAGGIAHDFNNILTAVMGNLFMAKINIDKDGDAYKAIMDAEKAAFRATKLTGQLLTFAKEETSVKERVSLREILDDVIGYSVSDEKIDVRMELPQDLYDILIDRGQIDQVFNNIILNAVQAMPEGGAIIIRGENVTVEDTSSHVRHDALPLDPGTYVMISIEDNGIGIHPDDLDRIFDPYFTTKLKGSGLGLTVCYSIVRRHHGVIFAKSKLGMGTTFSIYLTAAVSGEKETTKEKVHGNGKILFMDDEMLIRIVVDQILRSIGYTVKFAADGSEAVKIYKEEFAKGEPFDAVILDLTVPYGMGGKEAVKELLKIDPEATAVISSGYSNDPVITEYGKYGFKGVVTKPYMVEELNRVLHQVIAEKRK